MKVVGITGGIGSGKSYVCSLFHNHGVPIYSADAAAKRVMVQDSDLMEEIKALLGPDAYSQSGTLNRQFVASIVFKDPDKLKALNALVHPAVAKDFAAWKLEQTGCYCLYEAAILIESGGAKKCDRIILVSAPYEKRIEMVMQRDGATRREVLERIRAQSSDRAKRKHAHHELRNNYKKDIESKVSRLNLRLIKEFNCVKGNTR